MFVQFIYFPPPTINYLAIVEKWSEENPAKIVYQSMASSHHDSRLLYFLRNVLSGSYLYNCQWPILIGVVLAGVGFDSAINDDVELS